MIRLPVVAAFVATVASCSSAPGGERAHDATRSAPKDARGVSVYAPIPGIVPSTRFAARVFDGAKWHDLFTMETVGPVKEGPDKDYIYAPVTGHSSSWATFEYDVPVTVGIARLSGGRIETCVVRPLSRQISARISSDGREVTLSIPVRRVQADKITTKGTQAPVNLAIEFNGNTKEMMSVFASPHLEGKPTPETPGVHKVFPGDTPPAEGAWHTLHFMPGVHNFGAKAYVMQRDRSCYIPGDAWIDSPFTCGKEARNIRIFGLGVVSGRKILRVEYDNKRADNPMNIYGPGSVLEGITIADSYHHSLFGGSTDRDNPSVIRNVKLHNWRRNTDGIHFFDSGTAEDCFFHTQDDMHYMGTKTTARYRFRRMVYWKDETFGVECLFAGGGQHQPVDAIEEDCDSIYYTCQWVGAHIQLRRWGSIYADGVQVRDYRIENPFKYGNLIDLAMEHTGKASVFKNALFKNIRAHADRGCPIHVLGDGPDAVFENITFEDIRVGDRWVEDFSPKNFRICFAKNIRLVRDGKTVATFSSDVERDAAHIRPDPTNLLRNPSFEIRDYRWGGGTFVTKTAPFHSGEGSLAVQPGRRISQGMSGLPAGGGDTPAGRYRLSAWVLVPAGTNTSARVGVHYWGTRGEIRDASNRIEVAPGVWQQVSAELAAPEGSTSCDFEVELAGSFPVAYVDDCRFEGVMPASSRPE